MLQFIVLGIIPGTNIQINFGWLLIIIGSLLFVGFYYLENVAFAPLQNHDTSKINKSKRSRNKHTPTTA